MTETCELNSRCRAYTLMAVLLRIVDDIPGLGHISQRRTRTHIHAIRTQLPSPLPGHA